MAAAALRRASALRAISRGRSAGDVEQPLEPLGAADHARVLPERLPESAVTGGSAAAARARDRPGAGSASAASAARRPKTRHSSSEFEASRFAPWTPVHAHSPAA